MLLFFAYDICVHRSAVIHTLRDTLKTLAIWKNDPNVIRKKWQEYLSLRNTFCVLAQSWSRKCNLGWTNTTKTKFWISNSIISSSVLSAIADDISKTSTFSRDCREFHLSYRLSRCLHCWEGFSSFFDELRQWPGGTRTSMKIIWWGVVKEGLRSAH